MSPFTGILEPFAKQFIPDNESTNECQSRCAGVLVNSICRWTKGLSGSFCAQRCHISRRRRSIAAARSSRCARRNAAAAEVQRTETWTASTNSIPDTVSPLVET